MVDKLATPEYTNRSLFGRRWRVRVLIPKSDNVTPLSSDLEYDAYVLS